MKKIILNSNTQIDASFLKEKEEVVDLINTILDKYDNFTKSVSPKHWRTTGHHFTILKEMKDDISLFSKMTENEKKASENLI